MLMVMGTVTFAQQQSVCNSALQDGEELRYKVKWNFLRLGTITVRAEKTNADSLYRLIMIVESNPDLMIVKIREYNESIVSATTMMSKQFFGKHQSIGENVEIHHRYDEQTRTVSYVQKDMKLNTIVVAETLADIPAYVEGPALFFFTRLHSRSRQVLSVPTLTNGKIGETNLDFRHKREYVEIDACDEPIRTRKYTGFAHWQGGTSAGLSGEFIGWVSDDAAAVPVRAEMKILLGSIDLELERWTRPGWNPPVYIEISNR